MEDSRAGSDAPGTESPGRFICWLCQPQQAASASRGNGNLDSDQPRWLISVCQLDWATGCLDIWSKIILGVAVRVFGVRFTFESVDRVSKADGSP